MDATNQGVCIHHRRGVDDRATHQLGLIYTVTSYVYL